MVSFKGESILLKYKFTFYVIVQLKNSKTIFKLIFIGFCRIIIEHYQIKSQIFYFHNLNFFANKTVNKKINFFWVERERGGESLRI